MTRRTTAGLARALPAILIAGALAVLVAAALLAACGDSDGGASPQPPTASSSAAPSLSPQPSASPSPSAAALVPVTLYFFRDGDLCAVERRQPSTVAPAKQALTILFKGPTGAERAADVSTALPAGVKLESVTIANGLATVGVSSRLRTADEDRQIACAAQIVYALTQFPTVRKVSIRVGGASFPATDSAGSSSPAWRRRDFRDLEPAIFVEHPGLGAELRSPFVLSGSASVYEGSFVARLVDNSGRRVVSVTVQASEGAPGRGSFRREVVFSTSAAKGTLLVYTQSMEDGSRQNVERIPVTFSAE